MPLNPDEEIYKTARDKLTKFTNEQDAKRARVATRIRRGRILVGLAIAFFALVIIFALIGIWTGLAPAGATAGVLVVPTVVLAIAGAAMTDPKF